MILSARAVVAAVSIVVTVVLLSCVPASALGVAPISTSGDSTQSTAPVGTNTTDPESSAEDATGPGGWILWLAAGSAAALIAVYAVRSGRGRSSGQP